MLDRFKLKLGAVNIFEDLIDNGLPETRNGEEVIIEEDKIDYMSIFKIPKYLERYIFYGTAILFNAIIFNIIILPIKTIFMITSFSFNGIKLTSYLLKLLILLFGVLIKKALENSFPIFLIHHKLRSLSGMKILTFIRIIEFLNMLLNKFNKDYDIQLISIIQQKKFKKKIITFLILVLSLLLNIVTYWIYMICISIVLNDPSNFIYPLFMKLNFYDIKKTGKIQKKKKVFDVVTYEIYDRFFLFSCLFLVVFQNYSDNKINSHNFIDYLYRILFLIMIEITFDWIKDIVIFKISEFEPNLIKKITIDLALLHEKLKYNTFSSNGGGTEQNSEANGLNNYLKLIDVEKLNFINRDNLNRYRNYLDYDNILCVELNNNIYVHCVIIISFVLDRIHVLDIKMLMLVFILLCLRKLNQSQITNFCIDYIINNQSERKTPFVSRKSVTSLNSDESEESSRLSDEKINHK